MCVFVCVCKCIYTHTHIYKIKNKFKNVYISISILKARSAELDWRLLEARENSVHKGISHQTGRNGMKGTLFSSYENEKAGEME